MMRIKLTAFSVAATIALATAAPVFAAPGDNGNGNGGCVDNFYGNATNPRPSGHGVLPSQSPGPWVNNPSDPDNPTPGSSVGDIIQFVRLVLPGVNGGDVIPLLCSAP